MSHECQAATSQLERDWDFHVPHAKGQSTLCFLFLFPNISVLLGASLAYWLTHQLLGCTPQTCKPCSYPAPRPKNEPGNRDRDINGYCKGDLTSLKRKFLEQHPPSCIASNRGSHLCSLGEEAPFSGAIDVKVAHQLPGKPVAGARLSQPLRLTTIKRATVYL